MVSKSSLKPSIKNAKVLILYLGLIVFTNCFNNEDNALVQIPNGSYSGIFTVEYSNSSTFSNPVTVDFTNENSYKSSRSDDYYPAGGSGTFEINDSTIKFSDTNFWTADFDWNLILSGVYDFSLNGNELVISANKNDVGFYKYELKKE